MSSKGSASQYGPVSSYFKNKEDAEWKSYLAAHKPNQATLGDVMPKLESE